MSADSITMFIDIIQSLMLPLLAGMLAVQAVFMRHLSRWLFDLQIQIVALTNIIATEMTTEGKEGKQP